MKQQCKYFITLFAIVLAAAAGTAAADGIGSGGKSVNEVFGRAAGGYATANSTVIGTARKMPVADISGRASQVPQAPIGLVAVTALEIDHYGRSSNQVMPVKESRDYRDTLAQTR